MWWVALPDRRLLGLAPSEGRGETGPTETSGPITSGGTCFDLEVNAMSAVSHHRHPNPREAAVRPGSSPPQPGCLRSLVLQLRK